MTYIVQLAGEDLSDIETALNQRLADDPFSSIEEATDWIARRLKMTRADMAAREWGGIDLDEGERNELLNAWYVNDRTGCNSWYLYQQD